MTVTTPENGLNLARRAWTLFEPIHAIVYFAPETRERLAEAGLRGGWMGYFASRSAPMGPVAPEVVIAIFHNFAPPMVRRAIPDAWKFSTPERILEARLGVVDAALRRLWNGDVDGADVHEAAELAMEVADQLQADGRPLFAAHAGRPAPAEPHLKLWHACTLLREHRFEGHTAALTAHGLDGLDSLITAIAAGNGVGAVFMRQFRGWTEDQWASRENDLRERGLLDSDVKLTTEGRSLRADVEAATDRLAVRPWEAIAEPRRQRLFDLLQALAVRLEAPDGLIYPNPIGVPRPGASTT